MVFITLGSQKFQFNRLLKKIDELIEKKIITDKVFAQIGYSDYIPQLFEYKKFLDKNEFEEIMKKSDVVITHGGTGAIVNAIKNEKKVIGVPRLSEYHEHVDNHQQQILKQFEESGLITAVYEIENLETEFKEIYSKKFKKYISNTQVIIEDIEKFIEGTVK